MNYTQPIIFTSSSGKKIELLPQGNSYFSYMGKYEDARYQFSGSKIKTVNFVAGLRFEEGQKIGGKESNLVIKEIRFIQKRLSFVFEEVAKS